MNDEPSLVLDLSGSKPQVRFDGLTVPGVQSAEVIVEPGEVPTLLLRVFTFSLVGCRVDPCARENRHAQD